MGVVNRCWRLCYAWILGAGARRVMEGALALLLKLIIVGAGELGGVKAELGLNVAVECGTQLKQR